MLAEQHDNGWSQIWVTGWIDSGDTRYQRYRLGWSSTGWIAPAGGYSHSITLSAVASSVSGTVRPSAFAVLRLITNSNFVGCCTGKSAGLAPFRIWGT